MKRRRLGVNIDHIATLRQARGEWYPKPLEALKILKKCKVDQVTIHLREDRRHIQDQDVQEISKANIVPVNLEMAVTEEMTKIACRISPKMVTLVPEKRQEITTEGGLDCLKQKDKISKVLKKLKTKKIHTSLFLDPEKKQIEMAKKLGADAIEIHTGKYCHLVEEYYKKKKSYKITGNTLLVRKIKKSIIAIKEASEYAESIGLKVYAGHGLHTDNLQPIAKIPQIEEYNIGHAIISRAVFVGLEKAIKEIQRLLKK